MTKYRISEDELWPWYSLNNPFRDESKEIELTEYEYIEYTEALTIVERYQERFDAITEEVLDKPKRKPNPLEMLLHDTYRDKIRNILGD